jgi:uncharacterized repeat protein (TIGR01451 family)
MKKILLVMGLLLFSNLVFGATIAIEKSINVNHITAGSTFTYSISVTCTGNCYDVYVWDTLPTGFIYGSSSLEPTFEENVISWFYFGITDSTEIITLWGSIADYTYENITNSSSVQGSNVSVEVSTLVSDMSTPTFTLTVTPYPQVTIVNDSTFKHYNQVAAPTPITFTAGIRIESSTFDFKYYADWGVYPGPTTYFFVSLPDQLYTNGLRINTHGPAGGSWETNGKSATNTAVNGFDVSLLLSYGLMDQAPLNAGFTAGHYEMQAYLAPDLTSTPALFGAPMVFDVYTPTFTVTRTHTLTVTPTVPPTLTPTTIIENYKASLWAGRVYEALGNTFMATKEYYAAVSGSAGYGNVTSNEQQNIFYRVGLMLINTFKNLVGYVDEVKRISRISNASIKATAEANFVATMTPVYTLLPEADVHLSRGLNVTGATKDIININQNKAYIRYVATYVVSH